MVTLVYGGSGSGKSAFAENLAADEKYKRRIYLAAMKSDGREARERIKRHRALREGKGFETAECPFVKDFLSADFCKCDDGNAVILVECISNLLANEMFAREGASGFQAADRILDGIKLLAAKTNLVIVTNDVFSDGISYDESVKEYMRSLGYINRKLARLSNEVYEVVVGIGIKL